MTVGSGIGFRGIMAQVMMVLAVLALTVTFARAQGTPQTSDFAKDLELDTTALKSCVESGRMQSLVQADTAYGEQLRANSTPTLFINKQDVVGAQSEGELVRLIRQELDRVQRVGQ